MLNDYLKCRSDCPKWLLSLYILCTVENLRIDEQDWGVDFFDPIDWQYEYHLNEDREKTAARHSSSACGIAIFRVWISTLFEAFDTQVSAASQNTNRFSKSSQSMLNFQPCRVYLFVPYRSVASGPDPAIFLLAKKQA